MRRLSLWMRARPVAGDSVITTLILVPELLPLLLGREYLVQPFWYVLTGVLLVGPLLARRTHPRASAFAVLLGFGLQMLTQDEVSIRPGDLAIAVALYTLVAYVSRRVALGYVVFTLALWAGGTVLQVPGTGAVLVSIFFVLQLAFCWVLGEFLGARRAYHAEVEHRLRSLEFEQGQQVRIAVAEERNRIARELHDVLAHSVSVMVTQADGAAYAVRGKPELAEQAVHTIGTTGRQALTELRSLLHVLRNPEEGEERSPQPTAGGVRDLVDKVRELGLPVRLELTGDFDALPTGLGLGVYRIVQESLTNVLKHAGWRAAATVSIDNDGRDVRIEVTDNGAKGVLAAPISGGNGLIGMRERATVYGGTLEAGPVEDGGWRVRAVLPLSRSDLRQVSG